MGMENSKKTISGISIKKHARSDNNYIRFEDIYEGKIVEIPIARLKYLNEFLNNDNFDSGDTYYLAYIDGKKRMQFFPISGRDISEKNLKAASLGTKAKSSVVGGKVYDLYVDSDESSLDEVLNNVYIPKSVDPEARLERFNYMGHEALISIKEEESKVEVQLLNYFDEDSMDKLVGTLERIELYLFFKGEKKIELNLYNFGRRDEELYWESITKSKKLLSLVSPAESREIKDIISAKEEFDIKKVVVKKLKGIPKNIGKKLAYWFIPGGAALSSLIAVYNYLKLPKKIADTTAQLEEYRNNLSQNSVSLENAIEEYNSEMGKEYDNKSDYEKELSTLESMKSSVDKEYYDIVSNDNGNDTLDELKSFENFVKANGGTVETIEYNGQEVPVSFFINGQEIDLDDYSASDLGVSEEQYEDWKAACKEADEFKSEYTKFEDYLNGNKYEDLKSDLEEIISLFDSESNLEVYIADKEAELSHLNLLNSIFTGVLIGLPISIAIGALTTYFSTLKKDKLLYGSRVGVLDLERKAYLYRLIDEMKLNIKESFTNSIAVDSNLFNQDVDKDIAAKRKMLESIIQDNNITVDDLKMIEEDRIFLLRYKRAMKSVDSVIKSIEDKAKKYLANLGEKVEDDLSFWNLITKLGVDGLDDDVFRERLSYLFEKLGWSGEEDYNPNTLKDVIAAANYYTMVDKDEILSNYDSHKDWLSFFQISKQDVERGAYRSKAKSEYKRFYVLDFLFELKKDKKFRSLVDLYNFYKDPNGTFSTAFTKKNGRSGSLNLKELEDKYGSKLKDAINFAEKLKDRKSDLAKLIKEISDLEDLSDKHRQLKEKLNKAFVPNIIFNRTLPMAGYSFNYITENIENELYRNEMRELLIKRELNFLDKRNFNSSLDRKLTKKIVKVLKKAGYKQELDALKKEKIFKWKLM